MNLEKIEKSINEAFNNKDKIDTSDKILNNLELVASYHPSPRNVNTKRLDKKKMIFLLMGLK